MTLGEGHGWIAYLHDKVRTIHPITTNLGSNIPLAMPWLNFVGILLETFLGGKFVLKISDMTSTFDLTFDLDLKFFKVKFEKALS